MTMMMNDDEKQKEIDQNENIFLNHIADKEIIQLKINSFPKGLVPLEDLFDQNDVEKCPRMVPNGTEVEDCNIGTTKYPKNIKVSTNFPLEVKEK